ncbi:MAG: YceD family protein [Wenzhouxiangella sp.]
MSRDFPDWVHPDKAAASRREFIGTVAVDRLPRLAGLVVADETTEISFRLAFGYDELDQIRVEVEVSGRVPMQCQRTLRTFDQEIESASVVGIVSSEDEAAELPEDYDPQIFPDKRVPLLDLIEEEVLLSLPLVPVCPESSRIGAEPVADTHRPFEALAALRKGRGKN